MILDKRAIRAAMREMRRSLSTEYKVAADAVICAKLKVRIADIAPVAVYLASYQEIDLSPLIRELLDAGVKIVAPRWNGETYELSKLDGLDACSLRKGPMGILEPAEEERVEPKDVAVWIIPGLAFTKGGCRLGYGGGWYDRLLSRALPQAPRIGVAYSFQIVEDLPADVHDVLVTEVVDET